MRRPVALGLWLVAVVAGSCVADGLPSGPAYEVVVTDLERPTQLFVDDQGWLISQLAGSESDGTGQVVALDPEAPEVRAVLVDGLDVPTGVARFDGDVWVMTADRLLRFDPDTLGPAPWTVDDATVAAGPLPNNGRSQGSLAVIGERLYYDSSGAIRGGEVVTDSGRLWSIDGAGVSIEEARGFKHAYAVAVTPDGRLVVAEVSDGSFDAEPSADALVRLEPGVDHGWPRCVAVEGERERRAVTEFAALDPTGSGCGSLPPLLAAFAPGATPTSVAGVPWDRERMAVVLWQERQVVTVDVGSGSGGEVTAAPEVLIDDDSLAPIGVVADGDRLLLVDFDGGRVLSLRDPG